MMDKLNSNTIKSHPIQLASVDDKIKMNQEETSIEKASKIGCNVFARITELNVKEYNYDSRGLLNRFFTESPLPLALEMLRGMFNQQTILRGALVNWDAERVKPKRIAMQNIGGTNLSISSRTGCKVDACHFSNKAFFDKIEAAGGKFEEFRINPNENSGLLGVKEVFVEVQNENGETIAVTAQEIQTTDLDIAELAKNALDPTKTIIQDNSTGRYLLLSWQDFNFITKKKGVPYTDVRVDFKKLSVSSIIDSGKPDPLSSSIKVIVLDKGNKDLEMLKKDIKKICRGGDSSYIFIEAGDKVYFAPKTSKSLIQSSLDPNKLGKLVNVHEKEVPRKTNAKRGTVILSQDQTSKFEQQGGEVITFLMEGMDVMAYNFAGSGSSEGPSTQENINASLEAAYLYVSKEQKVPDEKILAKGICFGGAPTAWLGKKYPKINIMLDQNPANFWDIAIQGANQGVELGRDKITEYAKSKGMDENSYLITCTNWLAKTLKDNFVVQSIAKATFAGYNVTEDIKGNKGHKLINIDVEDLDEGGGDDLVPEMHPYQMATSAALSLEDESTNKGEDLKISRLSIAPGAMHITGWWKTPKAKETVESFLQDTGLTSPSF